MTTAQLQKLAQHADQTRSRTKQTMLESGEIRAAIPPPLMDGTRIVSTEAIEVSNLERQWFDDAKNARDDAYSRRIPAGMEGEVVGHIVKFSDGSVRIVQQESVAPASWALKSCINLAEFALQFLKT